MNTKANRSLRNGVQVAVVVVGFMTLLSGARQALAGSWVPSGGNGPAPSFNNDGYTLTGINDGTSGGVNSPKAMTTWDSRYGWDDWGWGGVADLDLLNWVDDGHDDYVPKPVGGNASTQGTVTRTFKWIPSSGKDLSSDPPPSSLRVMVHSWAQVQAGSGQSAVSLTAVVDNGFLGKQGNYTTKYNSPDFHCEIQTVEGTFLLTLDNSTHQQLVTTLPYPLFVGGMFSGLGSGYLFTKAQLAVDLA